MTTFPPSNDLREINFYAGYIFDQQGGVDLNAALQNREKKIRSVQGDESFLLIPPDLAVGPTPNTFELRITGQLKGVSLSKPIDLATGATRDLSLEEADSGSLTGSTVVITGAGYARYIVVTAEWIGLAYQDAKDENQVDVKKRIDDSILYRVFMGAESLTPTIPSGDLATALANTGAIPVAVIRREFGQTAIDTTTLYSYQQHLEHVFHAIGSVNALSRGLASQSPGAFIRRLPAVPELDDTELKKILMTPTAAVAGGKMVLDTGVGYYVFWLEGKLRWLKTDVAMETADLDASSIYFLRAQVDDFGTLQLYTQKGTIPASDGAVYDSEPANLKGTPDAGTGGGFPTTPNDLLLGIIQTGVATSVPTWTPLYSGAFRYSIDLNYALSPLQVDITIPKPFSCDYEVLFKFDEANWQPSAPTGNHKAFHPLGVKFHFVNWTTVRIEGKGRWLEDNGSGALRVATTDEFARPGMKVVILPKHRDLT